MFVTRVDSWHLPWSICPARPQFKFGIGTYTRAQTYSPVNVNVANRSLAAITIVIVIIIIIIAIFIFIIIIIITFILTCCSESSCANVGVLHQTSSFLPQSNINVTPLKANTCFPVCGRVWVYYAL